MSFNSYRNLEVWKKAMELVVECYKTTKKFPKNETFGLSSQIQRASVSIPTNIAEGRERHYPREFLQYLSIAYGSLAELETLTEIGYRLNYIDKDQLNQLFSRTTEIGKMINGLKQSLKKSGS
ncbi:MAG: four helix bundle protein [bacterium]|nr:four helix bundle protein [bacterium]